MRTMWWSTAVLMLGVAVGSFLAAHYLTRKRSMASNHASTPARTSGEEESQIEPMILMPQKPPRLFLDTLEPIVVQPEPDEQQAYNDDFFDFSTEPLREPVPSRMPYADEPTSTPNEDGMGEEEASQQDTTFWLELVDMLQSLLPGNPVTEAPAAAQPTPPPPEQFPRAGSDVSQAVQMPMIPMDPYHHHHHYPSCPYLNGYPRGYPTFPQPAYHFSRPAQPTSEPTVEPDRSKEHMTPVRVHGGVGP